MMNFGERADRRALPVAQIERLQELLVRVLASRQRALQQRAAAIQAGLIMSRALQDATDAYGAQYTRFKQVDQLCSEAEADVVRLTRENERLRDALARHNIWEWGDEPQ